MNQQDRGAHHCMWYYDQLFVFKNSKAHDTIVCSKNIKPHFIGKNGKHSTFDEKYICGLEVSP
jgi:hypothetical protein